MSVILIIAGPSATQQYTTEWPGCLDAQTLLEVVYNQSYGSSNPFHFGLSFYGTPYAGTHFYGYSVTSLNGTEDAPNEYWQFLVNGASCQTGIDETPISDGDTVEFEYSPYNAARHGTTGPNAAKAKHRVAHPQH